ncbi:neutral zinc metallopeptidase [Enterococcus diestrammenae]|uniref:KPN_02809 family neutral zinc metallopeptidase n=1 Tax=Enterococcus diestrammenae TaxID=1155073 RepID=UPI001F9112E4|nr:neutral zinc metallopeptidase [Enterococcus diestrammenae]HIX70508.1 zinc metallopeptidase [Candidatus Enterococcus stercoravium]
MRWKGDRKSSNVEDIRGSASSGFGGSSSSGGGLGFPGGAIGGGGIGVILMIVFSLFFSGGDLGSILSGGNGAVFTQQEQTANQSNTATTSTDDRKEFASVVFAHLEDYWNQTFTDYGKTYHDPTMVLFSGSVRSACGTASSAVGPFYCPGDQKVYLDLSFQDELANNFGASGDFAMAYVIAHEVGHHVQYELGISDQMEQIRRKVSETEYNKYSVRLELQADYLAGCFAKYLAGETYNGKSILEAGDIDEAIYAANQIGDDTLQKQAQGYVVPDSFTHGTSAQRVAWFNRGYQYGDLEHGDTFSASNLDL